MKKSLLLLGVVAAGNCFADEAQKTTIAKSEPFEIKSLINLVLGAEKTVKAEVDAAKLSTLRESTLPRSGGMS